MVEEIIVTFTIFIFMLVFISAMFSVLDEKIIWTKVFYISIVLFFSLFVFCGVGFVMRCKQEWVLDKTPYSTEKIVSLNDNNMVEGEIIGSRYAVRGYIGETLYYQYMVKLNNGGYVANKVKADETVLYYTKDNFRVEWYKRRKKWLCFEEEETFHKIYIPENTISDDYRLDLE